MSDQQVLAGQSGDNKFWRWLGNIGNVVGIVGVVSSILAGKAYLVVLFVAIVGVSVGIWLMRQQWQRTGVAFLVVGLLSGLGSLVALTQSSPQSQPADQSAAPDSPSVSVNSADSSSATSPKTTPKPLVDEQVILEPGQAIDVDMPDQPITDGQKGAVGTFDLFLHSNVLLSQDGFYDFRGSPNNAYHDCKKSLDPAAINSNQHSTSVTSVSGLSYCFATSDNHIGWVRIDNTNVDNFKLVNEVLRVRVWDK